MIDMRAAAIIVDVQATPARWSAEVAVTKTMLARIETCFGLKPTRLAADAAYGSGLMIGWLTRRGITPHIPHPRSRAPDQRYVHPFRIRL